MIEKQDSIVLHVRRYGESSRIVTLYTRDRGKMGVVARGAARGKNRLAALLQPMSCVRIVVYVREGRDLHNLSDAETIRRFPGLSDSVDRMTTGLALVELVNAVSIEDDANPDLFDLLVLALQRTGESGDPSGVHIWFLAQLAASLGYALQTDLCGVCQEEIDIRGDEIRFSASVGAPLCGEHQRGIAWTPLARDTYEVLRQIGDPSRADAWNKPLKPADFAQVHDLLHRFLRYHVEGMRRLKVGAVSARLRSEDEAGAGI